MHFPSKHSKQRKIPQRATPQKIPLPPSLVPYPDAGERTVYFTPRWHKARPASANRFKSTARYRHLSGNLQRNRCDRFAALSLYLSRRSSPGALAVDESFVTVQNFAHVTSFDDEWWIHITVAVCQSLVVSILLISDVWSCFEKSCFQKAIYLSMYKLQISDSLILHQSMLIR